VPEISIVIMQEPELTPFDLRWRMFGVSVRVHPLFWVLAAFLGWDYFQDRGFGYLLAWVGCVFVSILWHEFGHVIAGRIFGAEGHILLYWFGGLAFGSSNVRGRWQRVMVYLAGPGAQLLVFVPALLLRYYLPQRVSAEWRLPVDRVLFMLCFINGLWAAVNLLPIFPLDGGQVTREICEAAAPGRGGFISMGISTVFCAAVALYILLASLGKVPELRYVGSSMYNALLFAMFALSSFQAMQVERARSRWDDRLPWER
jgi:stage IV sporulation protein FB